jgi:integrase
MRPSNPTASLQQQPEDLKPLPAANRRMVRAELMGGHTHSTLAGVSVHVWRRDGKYLARGRHQGQPFGETLGGDALQAAARLREILTKIDHGSYVRPSDGRKQLVSRGRIARLTLRELVADFLAEKRGSRGRQTAGDYAARLAPVLDFAERSDNLKRWPLAVDTDAEFVRSLRAFLFQYRSARNGRPGGEPRPLSARQIVNVLECLRTMLHWARSARVRKLPADWVMPLTPALIGSPPPKNPLRDDKLPLDARAAIASRMDRWQLCHLALSLVLPLRPDEAAGLLVGDVSFARGWLEFGERLKDCNFTKGKTAFVLPFPDELRPLLRACIGGRAEGPLLRSRRAFERGQQVERVASLEHLTQLYQAELLRQPAGAVQAEQDRKLLFRCLLRELGGVSEDALAREFKKLLAAANIENGATLYTLRSSVTTAMHRANLPHLEMRYLTGHAAADILNEYTSLDPVGAMRSYFDSIRPLLTVIADRARALGLSGS